MNQSEPYQQHHTHHTETVMTRPRTILGIVGGHIRWLFASTISLSIFYIAAYILIGPKTLPVVIVKGLMLDSWYKPLIDAGPNAMDTICEMLYYLAFFWLVVAFLLGFVKWFVGFMANVDAATASGDFIADGFNALTWRVKLKKAKEAATATLTDYYTNDLSKAAFGSSAIKQDGIRELVESKADELSQLSQRYGNETTDDFAKKIVQRATKDIIASVSNYKTISGDLWSLNASTSSYWGKDRGIFRDPSKNLIFVNTDKTEPALVLHIDRLLQSAEQFVNSIPGGTQTFALHKRNDLEMNAEALSMSREFYHDDVIPEKKDEIIRWALATVEEERASRLETTGEVRA